MQVIQAFNFIPIDYTPSFPCNSVNFNMVIGFRYVEFLLDISLEASQSQKGIIDVL